MKKLIYILLLMVCTYVSYWCGNQTWIWDTSHKPHWFNTEDARLREIKYCNAVIEGLHYYYQRDKVFWKDTFMTTKEYKQINEVNQGDWEDFYCDW